MKSSVPAGDGATAGWVLMVGTFPLEVRAFMIALSKRALKLYMLQKCDKIATNG
jgi:hypothetical protein